MYDLLQTIYSDKSIDLNQTKKNQVTNQFKEVVAFFKISDKSGIRKQTSEQTKTRRTISPDKEIINSINKKEMSETPVQVIEDEFEKF